MIIDFCDVCNNFGVLGKHKILLSLGVKFDGYCCDSCFEGLKQSTLDDWNDIDQEIEDSRSFLL